MVNYDRIVPVQKIDLLSLIGTFLALASINYTVLPSLDVNGEFIVEENGTSLANQPVKTLDFAEGATEATVYFIADYHFDGISIAGVKQTAEVKADGVSLYKATLASGAVTVTAVTPEL